MNLLDVDIIQNDLSGLWELYIGCRKEMEGMIYWGSWNSLGQAELRADYLQELFYRAHKMHSGKGLEMDLNDYERGVIENALAENGHVKMRTAKILKMKRTTLIDRVKKLNCFESKN